MKYEKIFIYLGTFNLKPIMRIKLSILYADLLCNSEVSNNGLMYIKGQEFLAKKNKVHISTMNKYIKKMGQLGLTYEVKQSPRKHNSIFLINTELVKEFLFNGCNLYI